MIKILGITTRKKITFNTKLQVFFVFVFFLFNGLLGGIFFSDISSVLITARGDLFIPLNKTYSVYLSRCL